MTRPITPGPEDQVPETTSATTVSTAVDPAGGEWPESRRETVLATALVGLVAGVALFGLAFPELLAPAVAIAVLAAIIALDWLLPTGELRQASKKLWTS